MDIEKNELNKWHVIDIRTLGERPVKVKKGTGIHCKIKISDENYSYNTYSGDKGGYRFYSEKEDQSFDFIIK